MSAHPSPRPRWLFGGSDRGCHPISSDGRGPVIKMDKDHLSLVIGIGASPIVFVEQHIIPSTQRCSQCESQ